MDTYIMSTAGPGINLCPKCKRVIGDPTLLLRVPDYLGKSPYQQLAEAIPTIAVALIPFKTDHLCICQATVESEEKPC